MFYENIFEKLKKIDFPGVAIEIVDMKDKKIYYRDEKVNRLSKEKTNYKLVKTSEDDIFGSIIFNIFVDTDIYGINYETVGELALELVLKELYLKKLENKLNRVEKIVFRVINCLQDAAIIFDKEGYVKYYNEKALELVDISKDDMENKLLQDFYLTKLKAMEVLKTGEPIYDEEATVKTNRGDEKRILRTIVPIRDEEGNITEVVEKIKEINVNKKLDENMSSSWAIFTFDDIVHESREMDKVLKIAKGVSKTNMTVLIQGESGTGKELLAHSIHNESFRASKPFIILDCSTIPRELVESELFGYAEGAFTGAKKGGKLGKFELANGGTIFLDEIGEMPIDIQAKLLRVLQSGVFAKVGGNELVKVDIRVIAATNKNLEEEVIKGKFREDLFYRLNMISVEIPPLRDRSEDIIVLANYFIKNACEKLDKGDIYIGNDAQRILLWYDWPGNIRQLENVIYRAVSLCSGEEILPEHLPESILKSSKININMEDKEEVLLDNLEIKLILKALKENDWNKKKTAEALGISRSTLYRKLKKYNVSF